MPPKILVSCPSAEVAAIAREMAPGGFETVIVNDSEVVASLPEAWRQRDANGKLKRNRERDEFLAKLSRLEE